MKLRVVWQSVWLLCIYFISLGCTENNGVMSESLPLTIFDDRDFFIGQSLNVLLEKKKVKLDESSHCYCGRKPAQTIFSNVCVNCTIDSDIIQSLTLDGSIRTDSEFIDTEVGKILSVLDSTYGVSEEIYDDSFFSSSDSLPCPLIVWRTKLGNVVQLVYTPRLWKVSRKSGGRHSINFASLTICTPESAALSHYQRSNKWNRDLLRHRE